LAKRHDSELEAWRARRLEADAYPYVFVDARYERVGHRIVSQGVLVVSAVENTLLRASLNRPLADAAGFTGRHNSWVRSKTSSKECADEYLPYHHPSGHRRL
jgi:transposase-like protein